MSRSQERLYNLLPAIYRLRDAEQGYPLRALLQVIEEQVDVIEDDIKQLYDNWFIETCQDWVVPYIGDLIGYRPVHEAGEPGNVATEEERLRNRILIGRQEVASTIGYRRRKGTLALLQTLAEDVAGWPAHAVEFRERLAYTQPLNALHRMRGRMADLRDMAALKRLDGPFDTAAHTVDVRRIASARTAGRYNISSVGVFLWRLKSYSVSGTIDRSQQPPVLPTAAHCVEEQGQNCFTFSALGHDTRLFTRPPTRERPKVTQKSSELSVPMPITHRAFDHAIPQANGEARHEASPAYYGPDKSLAIWADGWVGADEDGFIPASAILSADLSGWRYRLARDEKNRVLVDPQRGRIVFPPVQRPRRGVRVFYHYGFSADMGGGEYNRPIPTTPVASQQSPPKRYYVGQRARYDATHFDTIGKALDQWKADNPDAAVIEITDSHIYKDRILLLEEKRLRAKQRLTLQAANGKRPILRLLDYEDDRPNDLAISGDAGSHFTLDGLLITGRGVQISGDMAQVTIRHCTLVPGWGLDCDCRPLHPEEPSLLLEEYMGRTVIEHSILGSILVIATPDREPVPIRIADSILDATGHTNADGYLLDALSGPEAMIAPVVLTMQRSTVIGRVQTYAIELAENSLFTDPILVAHRQVGCIRFCYVPLMSRSPRRYACQPDLVDASIQEQFVQGKIDQTERDQALLMERLRVRPLFNSERYGASTYCQLSEACAVEIHQGADDESEMGAFHDLFQPQRAANLRARLDEYTPAGLQAGILFMT